MLNAALRWLSFSALDSASEPFDLGSKLAMLGFLKLLLAGFFFFIPSKYSGVKLSNFSGSNGVNGS